MELRASFLMGTDVVALGLWPSHPESAAPPLGSAAGLPAEVRCVDQVVAERVEVLARDPDRVLACLDRAVLVGWIERAEHDRCGGRDRPGPGPAPA